jgi:hypothetical protein
MRTSPRLALTGVSLTVLLGFGAALALAQTQQSQAASQDSGTMQRADKEDMRPVLMKLQELGAKPIGTQSVEETRKGPTPADAVKALLKDQGKDP